MHKKTITITLEEYKELLIIKGKYEELKNQSSFPTIFEIEKNSGFQHVPPIEPYKVTCETYKGID